MPGSSDHTDYSSWAQDQPVDVEAPTNARIRDRLAWFAVLAGGALVLAAAWRLITMPADAIKMEFQFSDLLSLLLALFAVGMSAAFYFRSTQDSNTFFANSYKFTRDVAEILGRIESGFGERLRHLDEGYVSMANRMDALPTELRKAEQGLKQKEDSLAAHEEERDAMVREALAASDAEREELARALAAKDEEVLRLRREVMQARRQVDSRLRARNSASHPGSLEHYLTTEVVARLGIQHVREASRAQLSRDFELLRDANQLDGHAVAAMASRNLYDFEHRRLTDEGVKLLKTLAYET